MADDERDDLDESAETQAWVEPLLDLRETAHPTYRYGHSQLYDTGTRIDSRLARRVAVVACALGIVAIVIALLAPLVV